MDIVAFLTELNDKIWGHSYQIIICYENLNINKLNHGVVLKRSSLGNTLTLDQKIEDIEYKLKKNSYTKGLVYNNRETFYMVCVPHNQDYRGIYDFFGIIIE